MESFIDGALREALENIRRLETGERRSLMQGCAVCAHSIAHAAAQESPGAIEPITGVTYADLWVIAVVVLTRGHGPFARTMEGRVNAAARTMLENLAAKALDGQWAVFADVPAHTIMTIACHAASVCARCESPKWVNDRCPGCRFARTSPLLRVDL